MSPLVKKVFAVVEDALREGTQADPHLADMFVLALDERTPHTFPGTPHVAEPAPHTAGPALINSEIDRMVDLALNPPYPPRSNDNQIEAPVREEPEREPEEPLPSNGRQITDEDLSMSRKREAADAMDRLLGTGASESPTLDSKADPATTAIDDPTFTESQRKQVEAMVPYHTVPQNCTRDQFIKAVQLAAEGASLPAIRAATGLESNMALGPIMTSARRVAAKWANLSRPVAREHFWRVFLERLQVRETK